MKTRSNRSIVLIELGVPRNVEPSAAAFYNVYLYGLDHLGEIVEKNKRARAAEIPQSRGNVEEHVANSMIAHAEGLEG